MNLGQRIWVRWESVCTKYCLFQIEEMRLLPRLLPRSPWFRPSGAACGHRCLAEGGGQGGPWERGTGLQGQCQHHLFLRAQLPPEAHPACCLSLPGSCSLTKLHRLRLWDPEPAGRGLMGPPPWWDLSPALTMRLRLLASLSGGGLAWQAGDHRWLAGEGSVWYGIEDLTAGLCQGRKRGPGDHRGRESVRVQGPGYGPFYGIYLGDAWLCQPIMAGPIQAAQLRP